jgi:hypothetical protein
MLGIVGTEGLESAIRKYLDTDMIVKRLTAAKKHMDVMTGSIVKAIGAGTPLQTVSVEGSSEACSIFISKHDQNMTIFASWHAGIDVDGRWRQSHVLLGVEAQDSMGVPLLDTIKWVNGLAFFKQYEQTPVIFKWPLIWVENVYRKSVRSESRSKACAPSRSCKLQQSMSDCGDNLKCSHSPHTPLYFLFFLRISTTLLTYDSG